MHPQTGCNQSGGVTQSTAVSRGLCSVQTVRLGVGAGASPLRPRQAEEVKDGKSAESRLGTHTCPPYHLFEDRRFGRAAEVECLLRLHCACWQKPQSHCHNIYTHTHTHTRGQKQKKKKKAGHIEVQSRGSSILFPETTDTTQESMISAMGLVPSGNAAGNGDLPIMLRSPAGQNTQTCGLCNPSATTRPARVETVHCAPLWYNRNLVMLQFKACDERQRSDSDKPLVV